MDSMHQASRRENREPLTVGMPESGASLAPPPARVLVVDDEPSVVDVFKEFLAVQGYELLVSSSAEDAMRRIPELHPDLILTDINLPGLSGLELMRYARTLDPEVVVVVVTGYASASTAIDALRQGAYDYITKPFDLDEVHQIVERGLATRRLRAENRELVEQLRQKNDTLKQHEQDLRERVRQATRQMTDLYEVNKQISASLELEPRLKLIGALAAQLSDARAAVVYLQNEESGEFRAVSAHGVELTPHEDNAPHFLKAEGPLGLAAFEQHAVSRRVEAGGSLRMPGLQEAEFVSLLAVPMVAENLVCGVLALLDKPGGFTRDDEHFLALYASQAAIAVRNSQLFEHTKSLDRLKSDFVAVVSHEIRTPLTSVKGAVELLSDSRYFQNNEQQGKLLTIAHANAERLLLLINDILDFSKLESATLPMTIERQRFEPVAQQAAHNLRTLIEERKISLTVELHPDLPDLMLDAHRIAQVLTNLLSNAIKFSPLGGRILLIAEPDAGAVRVGVRDFGEGIAQENLPKLFRKFSQIDSGSTRKAGGTGLGLVICKGIVEQHGGKIWVESTPGAGSTFYFTLKPADSATRTPATKS